MTMEESNEHDAKLEALFAREHTHLSAEPFLSNTLALIAAERRRAVVTRRVLQALGILLFIVATPWLIEASVWMSRVMEAVFVRVSAWLANPVAMAIAALVVVAVVVVARRRRIRLAGFF
jgi:ferric-dicitrate binding protein FerR (iron transport regulator)